MHPFHMLGVAGVFGGSLFSAMHRFTNELCRSKVTITLELLNWVNCRDSIQLQTNTNIKIKGGHPNHV